MTETLALAQGLWEYKKKENIAIIFNAYSFFYEMGKFLASERGVDKLESFPSFSSSSSSSSLVSLACPDIRIITVIVLNSPMLRNTVESQ